MFTRTQLIFKLCSSFDLIGQSISWVRRCTTAAMNKRRQDGQRETRDVIEPSGKVILQRVHCNFQSLEFCPIFPSVCPWITLVPWNDPE